MFDAKSLLESLIQGGAKRTASPGAGGGQQGGLEDILGQIFPGATQQGGQGGQGGLGGLGDILGQLTGGDRGAGGGSSSGSDSQGGLGDLLGKMQEQFGGNQSGGSQGGGTAGGGIGDILGEMFGQAKTGAREGAEQIGQKTGADQMMREMVEKFGGGRSMEEIMEQVKTTLGNNQLGTGAALGGLGALILGTQTGRSAAATAAKIGALALIGGLAYKAYKNYETGQPLIASDEGDAEAAPSGSGFEPSAISNEAAALYIRGMVAAAAADGRIDGGEQEKIIGSLQASDLGKEAEEFLANELNNPASVQELALAVRNPEEALQLYTAARIAIDPDTNSEAQFLVDLASALRLDNALVAHVNAAAGTASV